MKKTLSVVIDRQLYFAVKSAAPASGKKMQDWISDALRAALGNGSAKKGGKGAGLRQFHN